MFIFLHRPYGAKDADKMTAYKINVSEPGFIGLSGFTSSRFFDERLCSLLE